MAKPVARHGAWNGASERFRLCFCLRRIPKDNRILPLFCVCSRRIPRENLISPSCFCVFPRGSQKIATFYRLFQGEPTAFYSLFGGSREIKKQFWRGNRTSSQCAFSTVCGVNQQPWWCRDPFQGRQLFSELEPQKVKLFAEGSICHQGQVTLRWVWISGVCIFKEEGKWGFFGGGH